MNDYNTDEEELEKLKNWWNDNKVFVVTGLVAGGAILFGYNWYKDMTRTRAETASAVFSELETAVAGNDRNVVLSKAAELKNEFSATPYDAQAALSLAKVHVDAGDFESAIAALKDAVDSGGPELSHIARLRLARVQLAAGDTDAAQATLKVRNEGEFSPLYQEVRGDVFVALGDNEAAIEQYKLALAHDIPLGDVSFLEMKLQNLGASTD
ncbi:MAG: tetratricopeptide repeat protein [Pseudomonadota bacterium]